ncbi:hypothetical protein LZD49_12425 [Dyadobacter sp. CY261]|uniref:hypothetical protein n=1 Tax=Dyadobacter sp. CY261 TaxID=2907203 RepID=UPI001F377746|nr:hypothetical protein [Dyadobacter sp. CY261]MCF0071278.1 hypothetical protein [Dyadobacter sp. CY261]
MKARLILVFMASACAFIGCRSVKKERSKSDSTSVTKTVQVENWAGQSMEEISIETTDFRVASLLYPDVFAPVLDYPEHVATRDTKEISKPFRTKIVIRKAVKANGQSLAKKEDEHHVSKALISKSKPPIGRPLAGDALMIFLLVVVIIIIYFFNKH